MHERRYIGFTSSGNVLEFIWYLDLLRQRGEKPLLKLLEDLGGWPVLDSDWDESQFDVIALMGQLRLFNNDVLISEWVGPDIKNSDEYVIQVIETFVIYILLATTRSKE